MTEYERVRGQSEQAIQNIPEKRNGKRPEIQVKKQGKYGKLTIRDMTLIGLIVAILEVCKAALSFLPNIELVSFWIILFTVFFHKKIFFAIPAFVLIEGLIYGFGMWWFSYLYVWPLLALVSYLFRRQESVWFWSILSSVFGLFFGFMCAISYAAVGVVDGGLRSGLHTGFVWWVAGIKMDIIHAVGNFVLMMYHPVSMTMKKLVSTYTFDSSI